MTKVKSSYTNHLAQWAHVVSPSAHGSIKTNPEDFIVEEVLGFELNGAGEHLYLFVEKIGLNTADVVKLLSSQLGVLPKHIAYSGLKDKHAVTRQWFSVWSKETADPKGLESPQCKLLRAIRHTRKLKRGTHRSNRFEIVVRGIPSSDAMNAALVRIGRDGVPNYFGEQRFGREAKNIDRALAMFESEISPARQERGFYLSAARAFLFNEVLSARVERGDWNSGVAGDVMMLAGSNSFFQADEIDATLERRVRSSDVHPSAPLWGKGALASSGAVNKLEQTIADKHPALVRGLEAFGLKQQRRSMRLVVEDLQTQWLEEDRLKLKFSLHRGAFATTVLRELLTIHA